MTSILKVDTIQDTAGNNIINESGDTITIGASGDTITIPSGATTTLTDGVSGDFKMNSGFGSIATVYGCRAWVNFNGTGTPAIRASGNVTSITDVATGIFDLNFTTNLPDVNYSAAGSARETTSGGSVIVRLGTSATMTVSSLRIVVANNTDSAATDPETCTVMIVR
jgi:hypothetical protein